MHDFCARPEGKATGEGTCFIYFVYITRDSHAYTTCSIDVYIRFLIHMHILDVLLLMVATTVIALLFGNFSHRATPLLAALLYLKQPCCPYQRHLSTSMHQSTDANFGNNWTTIHLT